MVEKIDHSVEIRSKSPDDNLATEHDEKEMRNRRGDLLCRPLGGLQNQTCDNEQKNGQCQNQAAWSDQESEEMEDSGNDAKALVFTV